VKKDHTDCPFCKGREYDWVWDNKVCDEHNVCCECGIKRKDLQEGVVAWGTSKGVFLCDTCNKKMQQEAIDKYNSPDDQEEYGDTPICPYCGTKYAIDCDEGLYEDGVTELTCGTCDKEFKCDTYVSINYTCTKKKD